MRLDSTDEGSNPRQLQSEVTTGRLRRSSASPKATSFKRIDRRDCRDFIGAGHSR
jgi:hypothetical protein